MGRITLIGTGHVFRIEETVRDAVIALRPDIVLVELDRGRMHALMARRAGSDRPTTGGFVQRRLQRFQEGVAGLYGGEVGGEMLGAIDGARRIGARIGLIDRPAEVTVRRAMKALSWRERFRILGMMGAGAVRTMLPGSRAKAKAALDEEVRQYQDDPQAALDELGRKFPSVRRVVIDERDVLMAGRMRKAADRFPHALAVVGDGHVPGLERHLGDLEVTSHRLPEVRAGNLPRPGPEDASLGFEVRWDPPQPL